MKTLKDINHPAGPFVDSDVDDFKLILKEEAINLLKKNKEINTADWVEFFNIEKEFADASLGGDE